MSKQNLMGLFNDLETLFSHPGVLGFNPLVNEMRAAVQATTNYPPRNIIQLGDDEWMVEVAVAGFSPQEISVETFDGRLKVSGSSTTVPGEDIEYLHQGMARRNFEFSIILGDHVEVNNEVPPMIDNGMLTISLVRVVPEALQPIQHDIVWRGQPSSEVKIEADDELPPTLTKDCIRS